MAAKKKASGKSIPEAQRHTVQVKLRLSEEDARCLRAIASLDGLPVSDVVAGYVRKAARQRLGPF